MAKRVRELNEAIANRIRVQARGTDTHEPKPRLAERIAKLAPLASAAAVPEKGTVNDPANSALSSLTDSARQRATLQARSVPGSALAVQVTPPPLPSSPGFRVAQAGAPQSPDATAGRADPQIIHSGKLGFAVGLSLATAFGIALYAWLV
jgi:hypothetical protein